LRKLGSVESFVAMKEKRGCLSNMLSSPSGLRRSCSCGEDMAAAAVAPQESDGPCYLSLYEPLPHLTQPLGGDARAEMDLSRRGGEEWSKDRWDLFSSLSLFGALSLPIFGFCLVAYVL
jgi:hypothetical protein